LGKTIGVSASGALAFVAARDAGVLVVDVSRPSAPRLVLTIATPGASWVVARRGDLVFVADGSAGLRILRANGLD
jgi:hypothetical protein